jgi:hypothetical protein
MPHYILKMTGFGKKMKKMEFHCCIMIYHCVTYMTLKSAVYEMLEHFWTY